MINIGLSPNLERDDIFLALKLLFMPWKWKKGKAAGKLEDWFKKYTGMENVKSFNSGRSGEYEILKSFGIGKGDEVLLQAFTCVAVPNPVLWTGAEPVYVDIDQSLTMDPVDLERKITKKAKAIIVQHTFGQLAKLDIICQICKKHNLFLIEDCAHTIKRKIGGDAAFYSFGRDKAVSSVFGGVAVINDNIYKNYNNYKNRLPFPSFFWILQQLLHPVALAVILPLYNWANLGKLALFGLQKLKLLSFPVYEVEKDGRRPDDFPKKMPNALAELALGQLGKLGKFEKRREELAQIYERELKRLEEKSCLKRVSKFNGLKVSWLRYPILVEKPNELREFAKKRGVILGNWYHNVIDPEGVDFLKIGYQRGSCPVAEKTALQIVNLPTYPRMRKEDAFMVIRIIGEFFHD